MKYMYALPAALMLLLTVSCKSDKKETEEAPIDPKKTDLFAYKLNDKVTSLSERSFSYAGGQKGTSASETSKSTDIDLQFDERGMVTSEKSLNNGATFQESTFNGKKKPVKETQYINGKPGMITEYQYDANGNEIAKTRKTALNEPIDRIENKYRGKNLVEKNTFNDQNVLVDKITYTHDKKGNITGENIYMGIHAVRVRAVYEYNKEGQKTSETRYNGDKLSYKTAYTYEGEKIKSKITQNPQEEVEYSEKFMYDKKGNVVKFMQFEKTANVETEENYTYDANSNLISVVISDNGKVQHKELFAYDKNNNMISVMVTDGTGKIINNRNYAYSYDSKKNWVKKIVHIMGQPAFIVERTITYYE